jgi:hypothetical protein
MSAETADMVLGMVIVTISLPVLYGVGRIIAWFQESRALRILAPLAPAINGALDRQYGILGSAAGRRVQVSFMARKSVGIGESAAHINAFFIELFGLPGQQNWSIRFTVSGMFGQGPKQLVIEVPDAELGRRLEQAGVLAAVARVSAPTMSYVTVRYEASRQVLTYMDDVAPGLIPSHSHFAAQLALVAQLAAINEQVNLPAVLDYGRQNQGKP